MSLTFYTGANFPADYRGSAFVALRGSWNRNPPTGYKVVRVRFDAQGTAVTADGALLVADQLHGLISTLGYL